MLSLLTVAAALSRSQPIAAGMSKRAFQALTFAVACYFAGLRVPASARTLSSAGPFRPDPDRACFVPLGLRDPALPPARARVAAFGLTSGGCALPSRAMSMPPPPAVADAGAVCVLLPIAAPADGYFFETGVGGGGDDADPVRWVVKVANGGGGDNRSDSSGVGDGGNGTEWQSVGASAWELWYTGQLRLYQDLPYPTPRGGGARLDLTAAPGWEWCVAWMASQVTQLLCFAGMSAAGASRREGWAQWILAGGYGLTSALNTAAALGFSASGRSREAAMYWLYVLPGALLGFGTAVAGRHILSVFATVAISYCIMQARETSRGKGGSESVREPGFPFFHAFS